MHRKKHDLPRVSALPQSLRYDKPGQFPHGNVEHYDIGMESFGFSDDHFTVGDQSNNVVVKTERGRNVAKDRRTVIRQ